jgi:hypothetical protein
MKNKKGYSLSGFTEASLGIFLVMMCLLIIVSTMDHDYSQNHDSSFGINMSDTRTALEGYQGNVETGLKGETNTDSTGIISVFQSWALAKAGIRIVLDFVTGNFITNAVNLLNLGAIGFYLGLVLRLLFVFALGYIFIKILFRVKP